MPYNEMFAHEDFIPTFCAAGGDPDVVDKCLNRYKVGNKIFHVHLDGYNLMPFFKGEVKESPRKEFLYWSDDGDLFAVRINRWKIVFKENNWQGMDIWEREFTDRRVPKLFDLLADPFERGDESFEYADWKAHRAFLIVPSQAVVGKWLESFKEFPIRQRPASFNLDEVMRKLSSPGQGQD
jgi:hypothetical protein